MKLAVIVPVKNRASLLARALNSLETAVDATCQDCTPVSNTTRLPAIPRPSIVVVDNRSTDSSREVARGHAVGAVVVESAASTVAAVRNAGAAEVPEADVYVFLDCDCVVPPDFFQSVIRALEESGAAAVGCEVVSPTDGHWSERTWDRLHRPGGDGPRHYINSACFCIRREWFVRIGGFDASRVSSEDVDICRRLAAVGGSMWQAESLAVLHLGNPQTLAGLYRRIRWHGSGVWPKGRPLQWSPTSMATFLHAGCTVAGGGGALMLLARGEIGMALVTPALGLLVTPCMFVAARAVQFRRRVPVLAGIALMLVTFTARLDGLVRERVRRAP